MSDQDKPVCVQAWCSAELAEALNRIAADMGAHRSDIVRFILRQEMIAAEYLEPPPAPAKRRRRRAS